MISNLTVPVLNRYDLLRSLLDSFDYPIGHLLVIDNGGDLTDLDKPDVVDKMTVLNMPANLGVASSWNLGVKSFPYDPVWFFSSADTLFEPGALEKLSTAKTTDITLTATFPGWQTFAIGEEVVKRIGLFDEAIHPIFFEDTEYTFRAMGAGITPVTIDLPLRHVNSATIKSDPYLMQRNNQTFASNAAYFEHKIKDGNTTPGQWDLERRRANGWEK